MCLWSFRLKEKIEMIRVMLIDDERPALEEMEYQIKKFNFIEIAGMVQDAREALTKLDEIRPDAVFLDIDMPNINGLELALKIQDLHEHIIIIFVTAYTQYALESFKAYPLDYIVKPASEKRLSRTMDHLLEQYKLQTDRLESHTEAAIHCFGDFEAFSEKEAIKFATRQVREMMAYLICYYEKNISREELILNIFGGTEDKKTINLLHVTAYNLRRTLCGAKISRDHICITGNYKLCIADGICDYVDFSKFVSANPCISGENIHKAESISALYRGSFLQSEDYIWAEEVRTNLEMEYENLLLNMANYYLENGAYPKCEKNLLTLISNNPLCENGYYQLLELYMQEGRHEKFRQRYKEYAKILKQEFQSKPDNKFKEYYRKGC
jgi:two-component system LytT family response regulator